MQLQNKLLWGEKLIYLNSHVWVILKDNIQKITMSSYIGGMSSKGRKRKRKVKKLLHSMSQDIDSPFFWKNKENICSMFLSTKSWI